jgi:hypothetical protein
MTNANQVSIFTLDDRNDRRKKSKNFKEINVLVNDQYFEDLAYGANRNYPTFITFVPPGMIDDNYKTAIFVMEPDAEHPDGLVHFLHEIYFLDKHISFRLNKDFISRWSNSKIVNIRSDYVCSFYL